MSDAEQLVRSPSDRRRVMVVVGTRPEAIKLAPVVQAVAAHDALEPVVVATAQHREMLDQVLLLFHITPEIDLDVMRPNQDLAGLTARVLEGISAAVRRASPDVVVVQGDTTTSMAGALAAFYAGVPVVHVEAGLRSGRLDLPFPEEGNRRLIASVATLHLAPTPSARDNLLSAGADPATVVVTGNTVIDALMWATREPPGPDGRILEEFQGRRVVLVTAHRRESWGAPLGRVARALADVAAMEPEVLFLLPAHRNPLVRSSLLPELAHVPNARIVEPLGYATFCHALARSHVVITDSGGVQEEAPSLGKPVLVLRDVTERPEGVAAGTARLVGTSRTVIRDELLTLLRDADAYDAMANAVNPYGDGLAAERTAAAVAHLLGLGPSPTSFLPLPPEATSQRPIAAAR